MTRSLGALAVAAALVLTGCSGGGGSAPTAGAASTTAAPGAAPEAEGPSTPGTAADAGAPGAGTTLPAVVTAAPTTTLASPAVTVPSTVVTTIAPVPTVAATDPGRRPSTGCVPGSWRVPASSFFEPVNLRTGSAALASGSLAFELQADGAARFTFESVAVDYGTGRTAQLNGPVAGRFQIFGDELSGSSVAVDVAITVRVQGETVDPAPVLAEVLRASPLAGSRIRCDASRMSVVYQGPPLDGVEVTFARA